MTARHLALGLALGLALALPAPEARAQVSEDIARLEVLPGWETDRGTRMIGLRITLAPGWKTYWRAPGDSGIPPQVIWSGTGDVSGAAIHWPVPEVFDSAGMRTLGYHDQVLFPVEIVTEGASGRVAGMLDIGVCEEVCVPVQLAFDVTLPPEGRRDPAIVAALVDRPLTAAEARAGAVTCTVAPGERGLTVTASIPLPPAGGEEIVVIEAADPQVWVSEADVARTGDVLTARADLVHVSGGAFALDRSALRFTVLGRDHAVDLTGCTG